MRNGRIRARPGYFDLLVDFLAAAGLADWLLPLSLLLFPAEDDLAPLASCRLLLPPFLPAWVGLLMMCSVVIGAF
jgi:hypothetical protein